MYVRDHYDRHAKNTTSKRARAEGPAAPLKIYHNTIKRYLLASFASNAPSLLDVACGRGGDLAKWDAAGIGHVHGIDISEGEIQEAERRYAQGNFRPTCTFAVSSTLATHAWEFGPIYDVVTCMFALHYFCSSERVLEHILRNVSASLKRGGMFIGTVPDGRRVVQAAKENWDGPMLRLKALWSGTSRPFGCAYVCDIANTVTSGGSIEYLVDEDALVRIAAAHGLSPVTQYPQKELRDLLENTGNTVFKHFAPQYPQTTDPSLSRASRLFSTFIFKKI
jgi:mRNA (guanine-N7-)-methyltransferase